MQNWLYEQTLRALPRNRRKALPVFLAALSEACENSPPPYGEDWYATAYDGFAADPDWLAAAFFTYACEEKQGFERLLILADQIKDVLPKAVPLVWKHARDEAQHILYFLELLDRVFPDASQDLEARRSLKNENPLVPVPSQKRLVGSRVAREVIRINIGEVKNRVHLSMMQGWAMAFCPDEQANRVREITSQLIRDEMNHILYTGLVLEMCNASGLCPNFGDSYGKEFQAFNDQLFDELRSHNIKPRRETQKTIEPLQARGG